jgi:uncharacterized protein (DUF924 family)
VQYIRFLDLILEFPKTGVGVLPFCGKACGSNPAELRSTSTSHSQPKTMALSAPLRNPIQDIDQILSYWFPTNEWRGGLWFHGIDETAVDTTTSGLSQRQAKKSAQNITDQFILQTFGPIIDEIMSPAPSALAEPELRTEYQSTEWMSTVSGRVALVILLDQLSRNAYRGTAKMFSYDSFSSSVALSLLDEPIACKELLWNRKLFLFLSLTHSEQEAVVNRAAIGLSSLIQHEQGQGQGQDKLAKKLTRVLHATEEHLTVLQRSTLPLSLSLLPISCPYPSLDSEDIRTGTFS